MSSGQSCRTSNHPFLLFPSLMCTNYRLWTSFRTQEVSNSQLSKWYWPWEAGHDKKNLCHVFCFITVWEAEIRTVCVCMCICVCACRTTVLGGRKRGGSAVISSGALTAYRWTVLLAPLFWLVSLLDMEPNGAESCPVNHGGIPPPCQNP